MSCMLLIRRVLALLFLVSRLNAEPLEVPVQAEACILLNPDTGKVLFEKRSQELYYPASLTKVATCVWALKLKKNKLTEMVTASAESLATSTEEAKRKSGYTLPSWRLVPGTSHMGLKKGEELPFKDLLLGMMVSSAGDAANVIAEYSAGSIPRFVEGMNAWVKSIGCKNTHFENPHGLFHPDQVTTAHDMAIIMKEALKIPAFRELISKSNYVRPKTNMQPSMAVAQTNRLLRPGPFYYSKAIGGKTGYLASSLNNFAVAAKDKDRTLIAVFLKTKERTDLWKDSIQLFEQAFSQAKVENVLMKKGYQDFILEQKGFDQPLTPYLEEDVKIAYYPAEKPSVKGLVYWDELHLPVRKGQKVGQVEIVDETSKPLKSYTLYAGNEVNSTPFSRVEAFFFPDSWLKLMIRWGFILSSLFLMGLFFRQFKKA